jgi:hypothetical protein
MGKAAIPKIYSSKVLLGIAGVRSNVELPSARSYLNILSDEF